MIRPFHPPSFDRPNNRTLIYIMYSKLRKRTNRKLCPKRSLYYSQYGLFNAIPPKCVSAIYLNNLFVFVYNFIFLISNAALESLLQLFGGQWAVYLTEMSGSSVSSDGQG
jgi:hypothetical protein